MSTLESLQDDSDQLFGGIEDFWLLPGQGQPRVYFTQQLDREDRPLPGQVHVRRVTAVAAPAQVAGSEDRPLPPIVKEVLEWYASDPREWIGFDSKSRAAERAIQESGHYFYTGEDARGHPEYAPNGVRAEEALAALVEWEQADSQAGANP